MANPIRARDGNGRAIRTVEQMEIDREAVRLRGRSKSYREIADEMGCDVTTARDRVIRGMAEVPIEGVEEARRLELVKLEGMETAVLAVLERQHYRVDHGRLIYLDDDSAPLEDDGPVLAAVDRLVKIQQRRAALLGLDKPERVEHTVLTIDSIDRLMEEAEGILAE